MPIVSKEKAFSTRTHSLFLIHIKEEFKDFLFFVFSLAGESE